MRKKRFILFSIWLALSIVLGHNIVPHHHHSDADHSAAGVPEVQHHQNENDENPLADFFSHFAHGSYTSTVTYLTVQSQEDTLVEKSVFQAAILSGSFIINYKFQVLPHSPDWGEFTSSYDHSLRLPARAPPVV